MSVTIGTREEILTRIFGILGEMSGSPPVYRNRGDFQDVQRPCIVMLDGVEKNIAGEQEDGKTVRGRPAVILMSPQIFYLGRERVNAENDTLPDGVPGANPVGPELNQWLDMLRAALSADPILLGLLTPNGQVIYRGCWTDMQTGSTLIGELRVFVDFIYVWLPPS